jgi:hypothetical protein
MDATKYNASPSITAFGVDAVLFCITVRLMRELVPGPALWAVLVILMYLLWRIGHVIVRNY